MVGFLGICASAGSSTAPLDTSSLGDMACPRAAGGSENLHQHGLTGQEELTVTKSQVLLEVPTVHWDGALRSFSFTLSLVL